MLLPQIHGYHAVEHMAGTQEEHVVLLGIEVKLVEVILVVLAHQEGAGYKQQCSQDDQQQCNAPDAFDDLFLH